MPLRKRLVFVCTNRRDPDNPKGSCAQKGSEELVVALKAAILKRGLAAEVRACATRCLDLCEIGAAVLQEPDHVAYGGVEVADVGAIVDALADGTVVERLVRAEGRPIPESGDDGGSE